MPRLCRPNALDKRYYFINGQSEVQRQAPFGTIYTPTYQTKIIGSKYMKIEDTHPLSQRRPFSPIQTQEDKYKQPVTYQINNRPVLPPIYTDPERNYQLSDLVALLPVGKDLPDRIMTLKNNEQVSLINITRNEICNIPDFINGIKRIYMTLTRIDLNLTGSCSFKQFVDACHQNNVHLAWNLFRVIGSLFVVSNKDDGCFVYYEKILSFLGAVYNSIDRPTSLERSPRRETYRESLNQPLYFHDDLCTDIPKEERNHDNIVPADDLEIIKMINEDLGFHPLPIQNIRLCCQRSDCFHRGTLSANQLEEICIGERLNLRRDTFDKLLHRCKYMGGGQFNWQTFIDFLEKVQPINTSLQIPSSKRPLDFVKHIPSPASSWPHAESSVMHHDFSVPKVEAFPQPKPVTSRQDFSQQHSPRPAEYENRNNLITSANIENIDNDTTRNVSSRQNVTHSNYTYQHEPWFNRFLKFVDAVYQKDVNSSGVLPTKELFELATVLNSQYGLNFTTTELISALDGSSIGHSNVYSNINSFLKRLSVRSNRL